MLAQFRGFPPDARGRLAVNIGVIAHFNFTPITVWVGWVPVVITPVLTVNVGLDGEVSVGITMLLRRKSTRHIMWYYLPRTFHLLPMYL